MICRTIFNDFVSNNFIERQEVIFYKKSWIAKTKIWNTTAKVKSVFKNKRVVKRYGQKQRIFIPQGF